MTRQHAGTEGTSAASTRVITERAVLSFPHLFKPWAGMNPKPGDEPKYSCALAFPPDSDMSSLKAAVVAAGRKRWASDFDAMVADKSVQLPFRDDGLAKKGYVPGTVYFNARSEEKPGVVMPFADAATGKPAPLTDEALIYPGAIVRASVTAFAYDYKGKTGVSFALNNVQWLDHGERLDSRVAATDDFDSVDAAPESLDDLAGML
jgi:hypothetical protein